MGTIWPTGRGVFHAFLLTFVLIAGTTTMTAQAGFTVSATPSSISIPENGQGVSIVAISISGGFNSVIVLSASGMPLGVTWSLVRATIPAPGSGSSTMTISVGITRPGDLPDYRDRRRRRHTAKYNCHPDGNGTATAELYTLGLAGLDQCCPRQSRDFNHHQHDQRRLQQRDHSLSYGDAERDDGELCSADDTGAGRRQLDDDHYGGERHTSRNLPDHRNRQWRRHPADHYRDADGDGGAKLHDFGVAGIAQHSAGQSGNLDDHGYDQWWLQRRDYSFRLRHAH